MAAERGGGEGPPPVRVNGARKLFDHFAVFAKHVTSEIERPENKDYPAARVALRQGAQRACDIVRRCRVGTFRADPICKVVSGMVRVVGNRDGPERRRAIEEGRQNALGILVRQNANDDVERRVRPDDRIDLARNHFGRCGVMAAVDPYRSARHKPRQ